MSKSVDQRVVQMEFDNQRFEKNIQKTILSLDSLKKGLNLDKASKNLSTLERAGKNFSMDALGRSVDAISDRFSNMGIVGITVLQNITNSAVNAGKRILSSLTVDPIKTGLQEYETKMNAITTILTNTKSKGTTLDDVNKALAELNEYADLTIYNFAEMTRNIGTFTAAGVELDTSVAAIKGIANLAAGSGSSAQQASTAMYQLSQALAAGSVKLMDWNSVVNAGMGGELFQNALRETAKEMNIFVDEAVPFRETLKDGWLTSDVLIKTLEGFSTNQDLVDAATQVKTLTQLLDVMAESVQSGWAVTWENIIGDKQEAVEFFTAISNGFNSIIEPSVKARNEALAFWNYTGGRKDVIEGVSKLLTELGKVLGTVSRAFKDVFPRTTGRDLTKASKQFKEFMDNFKIGEETISNVSRIAKGFFSVLRVGQKLIGATAKGALRLAEGFGIMELDVLGMLAPLGDMGVKLLEIVEDTNILEKSIFKAVDYIIELKNALVEAWKEMDITPLDALGGVLLFIGESAEKMGVYIKDAFEGFDPKNSKGLESFSNVMSGVSKVLNKVGDVFGKFRDKFVEAFNDDNFNKTMDVIKTGIFGGGFIAIVKRLMDLFKQSSKFLKEFGEGINENLMALKDVLKAYARDLQASAILKIAGAIGILAAAVAVLSMLDPNAIKSASLAIAAMFASLFGSMALFDKLVKDKSMAAMTVMSFGMVAMSTAILILVGAIKKIADLKPEQLISSVSAIAVLMGLLVGVAKTMDYIDGDTIFKKSLGLAAFAGAVKIIVAVVDQIGQLDPDALKQGLLGLAAIVGELMIFLRISNVAKMSVDAGLGMIALAGALYILINVVKEMAKIPTDELKQGLLGIAGVLATLGIFTRLLNDKVNMISTGLGIIAIAGALLIITSAIRKLGEMDEAVLVKGVLAIAGALVAIAGAVRLMPAKGSIAASIGIFAVATAVLLLTSAIEKLSGINPDDLKKALLALATGMGAMVISANLMTSALPGAAAMVVMAAALNLLIIPIMALAQLSWEQVGIGLAALAGGMLVVGGGAALFGLVAPLILAFAGALAVLSVAFLGIGVGFLAFSTGLATMATISYANIDKIMDTFDKFLDHLKDLVPKMVLIGIDIIMNLLKGIDERMYEITETTISIIVQFINGIADQLPDVIDAGFNLLEKFIVGMADGLDAHGPTIMEAVVKFIKALLETAWVFLRDGWKTMFEIGEWLIEKLAEGFAAGNKWIKEKITDIIDGIKEKWDELVSDAVEIGGNIIGGIVKGIQDKVGDAIDAAQAFGSDVLASIKGVFDIHSPSKETQKIAHQVGDGFVKGTEESTPVILKTVKKEMGKVREEYLTAAKEWIEDRKFYNDLTLAEEIKAWEELTNVYDENALERKEIDREIFSLKAKLTEEQKKIDTDYYDSVTKLQDKYWEENKRINQEYEDAVESRSQAIYDAYSLFEKIEKPEEKITGKQLVKNLEGQVREIESWRSNLDKLTEKGLSDDLMKELENLGPTSLEQIKALNQLSEPELAKYQQLFTDKHKLAKSEAVEQLQDLRTQTTLEILALSDQTKTDLDAVKLTWTTKLEEINTINATKMDQLKTKWNETTDSIVIKTKSAKKEIDEIDWEGSGENVADGFADGIWDNIYKVEEAIEYMGSLTKGKLDSSLDSHSPSREMIKRGGWAMQGFVNGIIAYKDKVANASKEMGNTALEGVRGAIRQISDTLNADTVTPVITPVVDMTNYKNAMSDIIDGKLTLDNNRSNAIVAMTKGSTSKDSTTSQNGSVKYEFNQTNNSPKALSRKEIYRNTNNQFSKFKKEVNPA